MWAVETKLAVYLKAHDLSHREFAAKAGFPKLHPMVSLWARGLARPSGWSALAIEQATGGEIEAAYWRSIPARKTRKPTLKNKRLTKSRQ